MFGNDIINDALLAIGVIYAGQVIPLGGSIQLACQLELNNMLAEWNAQGLAIFSIVKETFSLVNGTADYAIGTGATFNTARPEKIEAWRVIDASGGASGGQPVSAKEFAARADDGSLMGARIDMLNYDAAFPTGTIHLYPIPSGGSLELWVWEQMTAITDFVATQISFPPGYLHAIVYNLAVTLAPKFGRPLDPTLLMVANRSLATLGATNVSETTRVPPELKGQQPRAA